MLFPIPSISHISFFAICVFCILVSTRPLFHLRYDIAKLMETYVNQNARRNSIKTKRRTVPDDTYVDTVQEIMSILGISSTTANRLVKSEAFHTVHVGGHYRKGFKRW